LARLPECELMQLVNDERIVIKNGFEIPLFITVFDFGDKRHIGIVATRKLSLGHRKFVNGIIVSCSMTRMSKNQAVELYD